jgi:hypothetical protein
MSQRYLVNGEMSGWFIFGRVLGPLAMLGGLVLLVVDPLAGGLTFAVGLLVTLILEISAAMVRAKRCWIEVNPSGFVVTDGRGTREIRDDEVHAIAYSSTTNYSNGEPSGFTRQSTLWISKEPQPIVLKNKFKKDQGDPLAEFLQRLIDLLHDGFDAALTAGHAIEGDGWRLTQNELSFRRNGRDESLRLDEITAVESREGKMGIWRKGMDEPYTGFPINGRNVWLLRRLMQSRLKEDESNEPPKDGLGRILFQRKPKPITVAILAILAVLLPLVGIGLIVFATETAMWVTGLVLLVAGPLCGLGSYGCLKSNFRCHEWGVYQAGMTGEKRLMYNEVASFSYSATRHYHNGVYTGTQLQLNFQPMPGAKSGPITYGTQVTNEDADLEQLRDFVARVVSTRMASELAEGRPVQWTKNMIFMPEGIQYTPSGFFGKGQTQFLPHENYGGWNMDQGVFYLFERGKPKSVMSENVSEANFYPGFFLLLDMYHSEQEANEATVT